MSERELFRRAREEGPIVALIVAAYVSLFVLAAFDCRLPCGTCTDKPTHEVRP